MRIFWTECKLVFKYKFHDYEWGYIKKNMTTCGLDSLDFIPDWFLNKAMGNAPTIKEHLIPHFNNTLNSIQ